jgi:hypothetical protein
MSDGDINKLDQIEANHIERVLHRTDAKFEGVNSNSRWQKLM